jgi:hypothetical protein
MAHGIAGAAVAASVDGGVWNIKLTEWEFEEKVEQAEDTAAGDLYVSRLATFGDFEATLRGEVPDATNRHIINANETHLGTAIAFALKEKSADANPVVAATAMAHTIRLKTNLKGIIEAEIRINSSEGIAPTHDTTPLS